MKSKNSNPVVQAITENPWASLQDAILLSGGMIVAIILALEYDLFRYNDQLTSQDRKITLSELIFLTALLAVGISAFILRRLQEHRVNAQRQLTHELETQRLRRQAQSDPVTGLLNHRGVVSALMEATSTTKSVPHLQTLFMVGVTGVDRVNDIYGRATGDRVLKTIAGRLRGTVRPNDRVGRLEGANEFVVLAQDLDDGASHALAQELIGALQSEILVESHAHKIGAWVGATNFDGPRRTPAEILHEADLAMRRAKEAHQAGPVFYNAP